MTDLLSLSNLRTQFRTERGAVKAVDGIDLDIEEGETVGLVGESGSGKSVTALSAMGLIDDPGEVVAGVVVSVTLLAVTSPRGATDTAFALGALVLGFGVTAWSGTVGLGESIERMQSYRDGESGWTQAGAREAFAVLTWIGTGWALGSIAASIAAVGV